MTETKLDHIEVFHADPLALTPLHSPLRPWKNSFQLSCRLSICY